MSKKNILDGEKLQYMDKKIKKVIYNPSSGKKQFAFNVHPDMIAEMDEMANLISKISDKPYTRNSLVEDAIEIYLKELKVYFNKNYPENFKKDKEEEDFDTVIYPATEEGYQEVFLQDKEWYYVRIQEEKVKKIKNIAIYIKKPIGKILSYGVVDEIQYIPEKKKYFIRLKEIYDLPHPIEIGKNCSPAVARAPKYTTLQKMKEGYTYADL